MQPASLQQLQNLDRAHYLHPFTNHVELHAAGTHVIESGKGVWLTDAKGNRLLDGLAGLWCVNVGYGRSEINDAVYQQMQKLSYYPSFFNSTTESAILLARKIAELAPARLKHVTFSNSGSEANETALKLIRAYRKLKGQSKKYKILSRTFSYHGVTLATTSMTGLPTCYLPFDLPLEGFVHVPGPYHYGAKTNLDPVAYGKWCVDETERIIQTEGPESISAMFVEPIQGAGGVIVPPDGYLASLRALCRKYDILFVSDEVITAFGRLGEWFAADLWKLDADVMTLAKGLTSGYLPLGATVVSDEIADALIHGGYMAHGFTYSGHPATCAAGLANLAIIETENLVPRVRDDIGPYFQKKLHEFKDHPTVGEIRGYGLIGALELIPKGGKANLTPTSMMGIKGSALVRKHGAIVRGIRDLIAMSPPLTITHDEIDFLFEAIRKGLEELWQ